MANGPGKRIPKRHKDDDQVSHAPCDICKHRKVCQTECDHFHKYTVTNKAEEREENLEKLKKDEPEQFGPHKKEVDGYSRRRKFASSDPYHSDWSKPIDYDTPMEEDVDRFTGIG